MFDCQDSNPIGPRLRRRRIVHFGAVQRNCDHGALVIGVHHDGPPASPSRRHRRRSPRRKRLRRKYDRKHSRIVAASRQCTMRRRKWWRRRTRRILVLFESSSSHCVHGCRNLSQLSLDDARAERPPSPFDIVGRRRRASGKQQCRLAHTVLLLLRDTSGPVSIFRFLLKEDHVTIGKRTGRACAVVGRDVRAVTVGDHHLRRRILSGHDRLVSIGCCFCFCRRRRRSWMMMMVDARQPLR